MQMHSQFFYLHRRTFHEVQSIYDAERACSRKIINSHIRGLQQQDISVIVDLFSILYDGSFLKQVKTYGLEIIR